MTALHSIINSRIECSAKTLRELGLSKQPVGYGKLEVDPFFSWYAHLLYLNRRKCLLFVNTLTRYPVLAIYLSRDEIRNANAILGENLKIQLYAEGVSGDVIAKFLEHLYQPEISKSNNRSIIGTAVEYERVMDAHLSYSPENRRAKNQTEMSLQLARTPILAMKPEPFPYKVFSDQLLKRYGETGHFKFDMI